MNTTPEEFAKLLHESSLPEEKRQLLLKRLDSMTPEQIEEVTEILRQDVKEKKKLRKKIDMEQDRIVMQMGMEVDEEVEKLEQEEKENQK